MVKLVMNMNTNHICNLSNIHVSVFFVSFFVVFFFLKFSIHGLLSIPCHKYIHVPQSCLINKQLVTHRLIAFFFCYNHEAPVLIVCVEVLQPSQPNGVMSSAVSLPNHTFTGQA